MSFISQLECVGGLWHWAVYAALHIPDATERCKVCAAAAAASLLCCSRTCEVSAQHKGAAGAPADPLWLVAAAGPTPAFLTCLAARPACPAFTGGA